MSQTADTDAGWQAVLDELAGAADALGTALAAGEAPGSVLWTPPAGLGPLPEALEPRATAVLDRLVAAQETGRRRLRQLTGELEEVERRRRAGRAYTR